MNLFKSVRKFYEVMGLYPPQPNQNRSFNLRNFFYSIFSMTLFISLLCCFALKPTMTVLERVETVYVMLTELACVVNFFVSYQKIGIILLLIERFNEYIEKSKFWK